MQIKGDPPEKVEYIGMKNLLNAVKKSVGLRNGTLIFGFEGTVFYSRKPRSPFIFCRKMQGKKKIMHKQDLKWLGTLFFFVFFHFQSSEDHGESEVTWYMVKKNEIKYLCMLNNSVEDNQANTFFLWNLV